MKNNSQNNEPNLEEIIANVVNKTLQAARQTFINEWMSLKEGAVYAKVSYNTFMKFRLMGLKVSEIDGIKRVSRKEIDKFLENHSF